MSGVVAVEFGHFDTKSFRCKSTRYKLKSFRGIIKVDSIHVEKSIRRSRILLIPGTGNGERGTGNGEPGTGNGSLGTNVQRQPA